MCFNVLQQLSNVCKELLDILENVHKQCVEFRKPYELVDMELDDEPIYSSMMELHRYMKKLF